MCRAIVENVLSGTKAGFKATRNLVFNQKAERSTMNRQKSRRIVENVLSGTKAGFKATRNLVFNQKAERSTMNRQKSRGLVENVLSGMKAGFKSILNIFKHPKRESRMFNQKSSSTLSTTLLALILGASVFMAGQVWAAEMVKDPSTGKMVTAPEYGGTFTYARKFETASADPYVRYIAGGVVGLVYDKLGIANWATPRDVYHFRTNYVPEEFIVGALATSWETPDPLTVIFHIRKGVHWHDKPPMSGRELTADDIKFTFDRLLALGEFSGADPSTDSLLSDLGVESITVTDKYTVVFKHKSIRLGALKQILVAEHMWIVAPEVVRQYGDATDRMKIVGTGPYELTGWVEGSSYTWTKNPDYWGFDEKYPENRLPYIDTVKTLIMPEEATYLAALRSGQLDYIGMAGSTQLQSVDAAMSLRKTNPKIIVEPFSYRGETSFTFNVQKPPFDDVRVRHAIQMAIDIETINETYYKGRANTTPTGRNGRALRGYHFPFEEWPEELKGYYSYDPEGAEALLDEAGYPRGADGIRFSTVYEHYGFDLSYYQIVMEYLRAIGIGVEVKVNVDRAAYGAVVREHKMPGMILADHNSDWKPLGPIGQYYSKAGWNPPNVQDPVYDAMYEAAVAATTVEELQRLVKEVDRYGIEQNWVIYGPRGPLFHATQPWVVGFNGEEGLGNMSRTTVFSRLWIDSELKKAMGH